MPPRRLGTLTVTPSPFQVEWAEPFLCACGVVGLGFLPSETFA